MIATYKRAQFARKMPALATVADKQLSALVYAAKVERINATTMSYRARLAALQALSVANVTVKVYL